MEFVVYPRSFFVQPGSVGGSDVMQVIAADVDGAIVRIVFGPRDWEGFQAYVADHEAAARAATERAKAAEASEAARALLLSPTGMTAAIQSKAPRKH